MKYKLVILAIMSLTLATVRAQESAQYPSINFGSEHVNEADWNAMIAIEHGIIKNHATDDALLMELMGYYSQYNLEKRFLAFSVKAGYSAIDASSFQAYYYEHAGELNKAMYL